jgi:hypothetical protein
MTALRPDCGDAPPEQFAPHNGTAYLMIYNAVKGKRGLIAGRLHAYGESCAVGSFFDVNPKCALYKSLIDEVAAVNDSLPSATPRQRRVHVMRWLRWKLAHLGMPGFVPPTTAPKKSLKRKAAKR